MGASDSTDSDGTSDSDGENVLPNEDAVSGEEPLNRYPGSVMLYHDTTTSSQGETTINIEYGTMDSLETVVTWYEGESGEPNQKNQSSPETITLTYMFEAEQNYAVITVSETSEYTSINVAYVD